MAASGPEALALARREQPDVALLDLQMPGLDGIAVAEQLRTWCPGCASIILTSHGRPGYLKSALAAGVRGFLPKTVSAPVLVIGHPHRGRGRPLRRPAARRRGDRGRRLAALPREADVLALAAQGSPVEEIAAAGLALPGHGPQLPVLGRQQARRGQPARGGPPRPRPRLDLSVRWLHRGLQQISRAVNSVDNASQRFRVSPDIYYVGNLDHRGRKTPSPVCCKALRRP